MSRTALIVGAGPGNSASLTRLLAENGYRVHLAARNTEKLSDLAAAYGASVHRCDITQPDQVNTLFAAIPGRLDVVVANPSARLRGPVAELDPEAVRNVLDVTAFGAFLVGRAAAGRMLAQAPADGVRGVILMTGASAGTKGFPLSAPFAMGKFAQRGLAQSMSRELHPQGIHVAWINIDGGIRNPGRTEPPDRPDSMLDPDEVARTFLATINQHRSTWSSEVTIRPWTETF